MYAMQRRKKCKKIKSNTNRDITLGKEDSRYLCTWIDGQMIKSMKMIFNMLIHS